MDPSEELCRREYSLTSEPSGPSGSSGSSGPIDSFRLESDSHKDPLVKTQLSPITMSTEKGVLLPIRPPQSYDAPDTLRQKQEQLEVIKTKFDHVEGRSFTAARNATNPFERIGNSIFLNRAAVKLANLDAIYKFTGHIGGFSVPQIDDATETWTFCDLAGGPGGFTEYLQYRRPMAHGIGVTLNSKSRTSPTDWNIERLNLNYFDIFNGSDGTGDLYKYWNDFIAYVRNAGEGRDLVVADGGVETDNPLAYPLQEFLSSRLIAIETLIAVKTLRPGGNFVLKVFDVMDKITADVLYVMAANFESVSIMKPVSSRPANSERYVVGWKYRGDDYTTSALETAVNAYDSDTYVESIFSELPSNFTNWLSGVNSMLLDRQIRYSSLILDYLEDPSIVKDIPEYNLDKFLLIWGLPGNTFSYKKVTQLFSHS